jgi:FkbM family methyltransferase
MLSFFLHGLFGKLGYTLLRTPRYRALRVLENYKPSDNAFAEHLRHVFDKHSIDTVFDVGANDGAFAEMLRRDVKFTGTIHSFEPIPAQVANLRAKAKTDSGWIIHACALGAKAGTLPLHVMNSDVFSSFCQPASSQPEKYATSNAVARTIEVPVRTVAEVLCEGPPARVHLKMDTQGFDLEVFKGAAGMMESIFTLQSELALRPIYQDAPDWQEAMAAFASEGYRPSMLHAISLDEGLGCIEADGIFVR